MVEYYNVEWIPKEESNSVLFDKQRLTQVIDLILLQDYKELIITTNNKT